GVLSPANVGGTVTVKASDGCIEATTTVTFTLNVVIGTPPATPTDWDGAPVMSTGSPLPPLRIVYPADQTRFPRNIYRTLFQWRTATFSEFRLTFAGPGSTVTLYTDGAVPLCAGKTPAAGCFEADEAAWSSIAGSNAGQTVTITLDAL